MYKNIYDLLFPPLADDGEEVGLGVLGPGRLGAAGAGHHGDVELGGAAGRRCQGQQRQQRHTGGARRLHGSIAPVLRLVAAAAGTGWMT